MDKGANMRGLFSLTMTIVSSFVIFFASFLTFSPLLARAASAPNILMYQGRLLNASRVPVSSASVSMIFELYTASSGGTCVWSNSSATCASATARTVTLTDGLFSEALGDTGSSYAAISDSIFADNATVYLQITIAGETLSPRKQILSAPYALNSDTLDGLDVDNDGATAAAVVAYNSSGNLVVTGNPSGSGVSNGSLYINPGSSDTAANDTIFGVADGGTELFRIDKEGDVSLATTSGFTCTDCIDWSDFSDSATLDAATTVTLGSSNFTFSVASSGSYLMTNSAGTFLTIASTGAYTYTLDATNNPAFTITNAGSSNIMNNLSGTGDFVLQDNGTEFLTITDAGAYLFVQDSIDNPLYTVRNDGTSDTYFESTSSGDIEMRLTGTGDFIVKDNGSAFFTLSDGGGFDLALDATDNPAYTVTNAGSADVTYNLSGTGDFLVQDNGSAFFTLSDAGAISFTLDATDNPAFTLTNAGSSNIINNLSGTGDFVLQDAGSTFFTFSDTGGFDLTLDGTDNPAFTVTNAGSSDITYNLSGTGDFYLKDNGTEFLTITDTGAYLFVQDSTDNPLYTVRNDGTSDTYFESASSGDIEMRLTGTGDFIVKDGTTAFFTFADDSAVTFDAVATTGTAFALSTGTLTTGKGMKISRNSGGADFDGVLFEVEQNNTSVTSDGSAIRISQSGAGNASALQIVQNTVANATTSITSQAVAIDVNEIQNNDEVILIRSDADGTPDAEFRFENDGDAFADGAWNGTGADYAEYFPTTDTGLSDYMLVCQDLSQSENVKTCTAGEQRVMGVISTNPAFIGNNQGAEKSLEDDRHYRLVGMMGQIETLVSTADGAIAIGDPLAVSSVYDGYAGKASGNTYIIGRALESLASGSGTIKVLVQPMWYGGDILTLDGDVSVHGASMTLASLGMATIDEQSFNSAGLTFAGSAWNGITAEDRAMTLVNVVSDVDEYGLRLRDTNGEDQFSFSNTGDFALSGKLYPSDNGVMQYGAYLYYDSIGAGYMRTNAAGWASTAANYATPFISSDALVTGEIVTFSQTNAGVTRSSDAYDDRIAGVVSSGAGFLAGTQVAGSYPIILLGRVSTLVSAENGAIVAGDPLTTSSRPGYAMKATQAGQILGYALEAFSGSEGSIMTFVRPTFFNGASSQAGDTQNGLSQLVDVETLDISGALNMNGGRILSVGSISGMSNWEITENGNIVTRGQVTQLVRSLQNEDVATYAVTAPETYVQLSGTSTLENGFARIRFEDLDPQFNDIIDPALSYRVFVTPAGVTGQLYVTDRTTNGFIVHDADGGSGVAVDWLVIAYRHDIAPLTAQNGDISPVPDEDDEILESDPIEDEEVIIPAEDEEEIGGEDVSDVIESVDETVTSETVSDDETDQGDDTIVVDDVSLGSGDAEISS